MRFHDSPREGQPGRRESPSLARLAWMPLALPLGLLFVYTTLALAQDGSAINPLNMLKWQGLVTGNSQVECSTSSATVVAFHGDRLSVTVRNAGPETVYLCRAATCTTGAAGAFLWPGDSITIEGSNRDDDPVTCITASSTGDVFVWDDRSFS